MNTIRCVQKGDSAEFDSTRWKVDSIDLAGYTINMVPTKGSILDNTPATWNMNEAQRIYIADGWKVLACRTAHHQYEGRNVVVHFAIEAEIPNVESEREK